MTSTTTSILELADRIAEAAKLVARREAVLVAISGIDGSGKGTVARKTADELGTRGWKVALIGLDPWHHPQAVRLARRPEDGDPALRFYRNAFRWDELFDRLIEPLRRLRSIELTASLIEVATDNRYSHTYRFTDVDVVLLEGIFLLRKDLRPRYDLAIWIECSFETALGRAVARNQEGLPQVEIVADYNRIYFPAQRLHVALDAPAEGADLIHRNEGFAGGER